MVKSALKRGANDTQQRQFSKWVRQAEELDNAIKQEKLQEEAQGINYNSASEDDSENEVDKEESIEQEKDEKNAEMATKKKFKSSNAMTRFSARTRSRVSKDHISNPMYEAQNAKRHNFF